MLWHTFGSSSTPKRKVDDGVVHAGGSIVGGGHFWSLFLPSFSHVGLSHITGNMLLFLYLGRKIHELLGPAKFVGLIFAELQRAIATEISYRLGAAVLVVRPILTQDMFILNGERPESMKSLGASDAVMGMVGFFYLCFREAACTCFETWTHGSMA